ncbi:PREDICTED: cytochrome c oxidase assembly protein COX16 homolog, mitochondrial isoform X2 [Vollenhovia emeryi]|uniref:cytochrome c oxidase assembly protein COX16 homolog, mitochondrial isoform X2 n=1 Tax=Vollenhovia emeryi TaxID=411798 RepID=UPI0005F39814|nr:PREDICTED: cytochrome c oxidase assembly protein COX16 homolog, mitochondrial isoform X2 [Vollenhovia emeryi]
MNNVMSHPRVWRYGIPFMIFIIGGSFGLREFTELRYKRTNEYKIREELEKQGIQMREPEEITLEKEYEKLQEVDLDNWENVRIQRPWDESENTTA